MNRFTRGCSALLAVIVLSACVAIPENPPTTPTPRLEREVSDLASAFAKMYSLDSADEVRDRLTELGGCIFHEMVGETKLTPEELDVVVIYMSGLIHSTAMFTRMEAVESGKLDKLFDSDPESAEDLLIQQIDLAIDFCYGDD